jgi:outer membrane receptor protein involved in Fe transport
VRFSCACLLITWLGLPTPGQGALQEENILGRIDVVPLPEAPLAASSFSERRLEETGVRQLTELASRTPGLVLSPGQSTLAIRGIGARAGALSTAVAVYADGAYLGDWRFLDTAQFFDAERIEVLRGPQSVTLGPGAVAGALHLHSTPPPMTWQSKVVAETGSDQLWAAQGLIRGPITDQFAMSVAGSTLQRTSWDEDPRSASDQTGRDDQYLRAAFTYHWTNLWYSRLQAVAIDREDGDLATALLLNEIALGELRLKYLATWTERDWFDEPEAQTAGHELSLYSAPGAPVGFSLGLLYRDENVRLEPGEPDRDNETLSAWLTAEAPITDRLNIAAGLRYSDQEAGRRVRVSDRFWDGDLTASYRWQDTQQLYLRLAVAHLGPDVAGPQSAATALAGKLETIELGHKGTFLDGNMLTLLAVYQNRPDNLPGAVHNSYGVEWDVSWQLTKGWRLGASWAWADDHRPALQPQQQLSLLARRDWRWGWADMALSLEYLYQSGTCPGLTPCDANRGDSTHQWDVSLGAHYREWTLSVYADNVADQRDWYSPPPSSGSTVPELPGELTAPRQLGLRVIYQLR